MLIAGIFLILVLTTLAAYIMKKRGVRLAYVWLLLTFTGLIILAILLFISSERINPLYIQNWYKTGNSQLTLIFRINQTNWPVLTALMALHVAFLLTTTARQDFRREFIFWIVEAGEVALSFAILTAADLWALVFTWTALDVADLVYKILIRETTDFEGLYRSYILKLAGSLLLIMNAAQLAGNNQSILLESLPASNSTSIFFSAILHSGILPLLPINRSKKEVETLLDYFTFLFPLVNSLFLIIYLPQIDLSLFVSLAMQLLFIILFLYFVAKWLNASDEVSGTYSLLYSFPAYIGYRFLVNLHTNAVSWFVVLLICVTWLLLFNRRGRSVVLLPVFILISLTGLPFSLVSYGSNSNLISSVTISSLFLIVFHVLFFTGFARLLFQPKAQFEDLESSFQVTYLTGLFLPILSLAAITFRSMGSIMGELSSWWAGSSILIISIGLYFWLKRKTTQKTSGDSDKKSRLEKLSNLLSMDWFFVAANYVVTRIKPLVSGFSTLLEGEGGMLWSIVFLALLITLLRTG